MNTFTYVCMEISLSEGEAGAPVSLKLSLPEPSRSGVGVGMGTRPLKQLNRAALQWDGLEFGSTV
jgi:hypothetical protein